DGLALAPRSAAQTVPVAAGPAQPLSEESRRRGRNQACAFARHERHVAVLGAYQRVGAREQGLQQLSQVEAIDHRQRGLVQRDEVAVLAAQLADDALHAAGHAIEARASTPISSVE